MRSNLVISLVAILIHFTNGMEIMVPFLSAEINSEVIKLDSKTDMMDKGLMLSEDLPETKLDTESVIPEDESSLIPPVTFNTSPSGGYDFQFETPSYNRKETRDNEGKITGEYSFTDADGLYKTYKYESGLEGFRIIDGILPVAPTFVNVPVEEPIELINERNRHLEIVEKIRNNPDAFPLEWLIVPSIYKPEELPVAVEYAPDVQEAREIHLKQYNSLAAQFL